MADLTPIIKEILRIELTRGNPDNELIEYCKRFLNKENESPLKEQQLFMDILNDERDENS